MNKTEWQREYRKRYTPPKVTVTCPECNKSRLLFRYRAKGRTFVACTGCSGIINARNHKERTGHGFGYKGSKHVNGEYISQVKRNAQNRGIEYDLSLDDLDAVWERQKGLCALTGRIMTQDTNDPNKRSLDRIDPSKGYFPDNVQFVTVEANNFKTVYTEAQLFALCNDIVKTIGGQHA